MYKIRGGIAVIITTIIGILLLIVALYEAQEAMQIKSITKEALFYVSGRARFSERSDEQLWRPKKTVEVTLENYPISFSINKKSTTCTAASFEAAIDTSRLIRIAIPKSALALLYTHTTIPLYEVSLTTGKTLFSFSDAMKRDSDKRFYLYLQAVLCFLGGLVLLLFPKRLLLKD